MPMSCIIINWWQNRVMLSLKLHSPLNLTSKLGQMSALTWPGSLYGKVRTVLCEGEFRTCSGWMGFSSECERWRPWPWLAWLFGTVFALIPAPNQTKESSLWSTHTASLMTSLTQFLCSFQPKQQQNIKNATWHWSEPSWQFYSGLVYVQRAWDGICLQMFTTWTVPPGRHPPIILLGI